MGRLQVKPPHSTTKPLDLASPPETIDALAIPYESHHPPNSVTNSPKETTLRTPAAGSVCWFAFEFTPYENVLIALKPPLRKYTAVLLWTPGLCYQRGWRDSATNVVARHLNSLMEPTKTAG